MSSEGKTADVSAVAGLSDIASFSERDRALAQMLVECGQSHLFEGWTPGSNADEKKAFFDSVAAANDGYPGGIPAYVESGRKNLAASAAGENPFEGLTPEVPSGVTLGYETPEFVEAEASGVALWKDCCFVLVAGGLGERLGYNGIKVALPTEITTGRTYLELYCKQILARQAASNAAAGTSAVCPLVIMTSDDTHTKTVELLAANGNYGMAEGQITILKQEKVPALLDNDAHIARNGTYGIETKPHGHGDVHTLLASSGMAEAWAKEGKKYVVFFQDTNAMAFRVVPATIGVSEKEGLALNSICVPREAGAAVGAIARLVNKATGESTTINVEYNQLSPLLKATISPEGDVADPATGFSPFPGNVNQLVLAVPAYAAALARTGGLVPEFVNPKYANAEKTVFTKPTRLECMMQDIPRTLAAEDKVGFTSFEAWTYSPVKNSVEEALKKIASGNSPCCASSGEMDIYEAEARALRVVGCDVAAASEELTSNGITVKVGARIVLDPRMTTTRATLAACFPSPDKVKISAKSTLVVEGDASAVRIESLELDGALIVRAPEGASVVVRGKAVRNAGHSFVPLAEGEEASDALAIRGYKLAVNEEEVVAPAAGAGETVVADA